MLRQTSRLLLAHGALAQQAAACSHLQFSSLLTQTRSRSDSTNTPGGGLNGAIIAQDSQGVANGLDLSAGELLAHADSVISASEAAEAAVFLAVKADSWVVSRQVLNVLSWTHEYMPWFEAIAISNVVLKLCTLPLTVYSQIQAPQMQAIRTKTEHIQKLSKQMNQAQSASDYEKYAQQYRTAMEDFQKNHKNLGLRAVGVPMLGIFQAVVLVSHFSAVSSLTRAKLPSMTTEGGLWFTDLTIPDPYYGLPVIAALSTLAMLNTSQMGDQLRQMGSKADLMRMLMGFAALSMIAAGHYVSSALALLWGSNALLALAQNYVLGRASVRKAIGLPPLKGADVPAVQQMLKWFNDRSNPKAAAAAVSGALGAPPPGSRPAVNYLANKPRQRRR